VRWHLCEPARRELPERARARLAALELELGPLALDRAVAIGESVRCVLVGSAPDDAEVSVERALFSRGYGQTETLPLVSHRARLTLPKILRTFLVRIGA